MTDAEDVACNWGYIVASAVLKDAGIDGASGIVIPTSAKLQPISGAMPGSR